MSGKKAKADRARLREEMQAAAEGTAYWHGGPDGLKVGTVLLPTTQLHPLPPDSRLDHPWFSDIDHSHVCATTDRTLARDYAAGWDLEKQAALIMALSADGALPGRNPWRDTPRTKGGTLYRVQPLGPLTRDPDYEEGVSFRMPRARVIAVEEAGVPYNPKPSPGALHYTKWDTGERLWDDEGYAIANRLMQSHGVTSAALRPLGYAPDADTILRYAQQIAATRRQA